jgi:hypothetical protein
LTKRPDIQITVHAGRRYYSARPASPYHNKFLDHKPPRFWGGVADRRQRHAANTSRRGIPTTDSQRGTVSGRTRVLAIPKTFRPQITPLLGRGDRQNLVASLLVRKKQAAQASQSRRFPESVRGKYRHCSARARRLTHQFATAPLHFTSASRVPLPFHCVPTVANW